MKFPARDKWVHIITGIPMGIILQLLGMHFLHLPIWIIALLVLFTSFIISYGFELISLITKKGEYDFFDAIASISGAALGIGFILLLQCLRG